MIEIMDLRPGNYVRAGEDERPLRVIAIDLLDKSIRVKEDHSTTIESYAAGALQGCPLDGLSHIIGGLSFNEHALLIKGDEVWIVLEEGAAFSLPHIRYIHQFQNLFRSLTGLELPFNLR